MSVFDDDPNFESDEDFDLEDSQADWVEFYCPHCGAGPADSEDELPHFNNCQDAVCGCVDCSIAGEPTH